MRKCPNCGEVLQEHDRVCRNCGAFLDVVTTPEEEPLFEEEDFPKKEEDKEQDFLDIPSYSEVSFNSEKPKTKSKFYWKPPVLCLILGLIFIATSIIIKTLENNQTLLIKAFELAGIISGILTILSLIVVIILYATKKEFHYIMTPREIIDSNASPVEQRRMAYVGRNYVKISKKNFSFSAFLLNWYYLLYRKKYLMAGLGMLVTIVLTMISNTLPIMKYIIVAITVVVSSVLGVFFNSRYIKFINKKTKILKEKNSNLDVETFLKLCQRKGGTSLFSSTIIYTLFLIVIILICNLSIFRTMPRTKNEKEEKPDVEVKVIDREYQKKKSQCKSYAQAVYQSYSEANLEIEYIGCNMGKEKYVILKTASKDNQVSYIAKYEINLKKEELKLLNTTLNMDTLRQKQQSKNLTSEETNELTEKETIEREFSSFDTKVAEDQKAYKKDETYVRNYIEIDISSLKK